MNDILKYFRHIYPGLLFVIFLSLYFFISGRIESVDAESWTGIAAVAALLLPLIGYILSSIHHLFYQETHNRFLAEFQIRYPDHFPREMALTWGVFLEFWYSLSKVSTIIEKSSPRTESLADLYHTNGASIIALYASLIIDLIFLVIDFVYGNFDPLTLSLFLFGGGLCMILKASKVTLEKNLYDFIRAVLDSTLASSKPGQQ